MIVKLIKENKESWDEFLDTCVFAYNTAEHESTKFTSFELMCSRKAVIPVNIEKSGSEVEIQISDIDILDTEGK